MCRSVIFWSYTWTSFTRSTIYVLITIWFVRISTSSSRNTIVNFTFCFIACTITTSILTSLLITNSSSRNYRASIYLKFRAAYTIVFIYCSIIISTCIIKSYTSFSFSIYCFTFCILLIISLICITI